MATQDGLLSVPSNAPEGGRPAHHDRGGGSRDRRPATTRSGMSTGGSPLRNPSDGISWDGIGFLLLRTDAGMGGEGDAVGEARVRCGSGGADPGTCSTRESATVGRGSGFGRMSTFATTDTSLRHDGSMIDPIAPVVPPGRMKQTRQPDFTLPGNMHLRPWQESDAQILVQSCLDPDIQHWNRPGRLTTDTAREKIERWKLRWQDEEAAIWAVTPADDAPVGLIGLADLDLPGGSGEFVYWLLPAGRGRGAMVNATLAVSRWAFDTLGLHRLRITHSVNNTASCRVATQAGFAWEGTMRSALLHADGWHDEHLHARIQGDTGPA
ncbi:GNAT family N-acetyltransferase [Streptomyces litmocidini]|uniref:GNAT family N-acetyltransferase n=1 Tax=Streptomyces litmocidini TaxID=67318 RepID=UPI003700B581